MINQVVLPLTNEEIDFITLIRASGEVKPMLITSDKSLGDKILLHPAIHWAIAKFNKNKL